ncbi:MAG TPA: DinB family protein [Candidatus Acidoferrum sp.]|nr:DinB family protein [Candidatus Acidoferrum sp.]
MTVLQPIREKLRRAQGAFFRAADAIPVDKWGDCPGVNEWSAAQLVAHLVVVERGIVTRVDQLTQNSPIPIPFLKRIHLPLWLVEARVIRRKSPVPLDESLLAEKEPMLAGLRGVRERTMAFIEETERRDLSGYCWRHPFLGMLNVYEWMGMIAAHQLRHTKQVREIEAKLSRKL